MEPTLDDIEIRHHYEPGDIGAVASLHGKLYSYGRSFEAYVASTLGDFYQNMSPENEQIWLASHNDQIVGSIALKSTDGWAQLRYFLVDPAYRGIGLGRQLIGGFAEYMKANGYSKSFLLTEENLKTAAALYTHLGYKFVSSSETIFGLKEQRYELHL
jgi:ribosomal protein S18 acetylase RimI-like enzyme